MRQQHSYSRIRKINPFQEQIVQSNTVPAQASLQNSRTTEFELQNRRKIRSQEIMQAVHNIDHTQDDAYRVQLIQWLEQAYADQMGGVLVGLFSRCYLGAPYIDHRLSLAGNIIEHYCHDQTPPPPYDRARPFIRSGAYEFVEIYSDGEVVPISPNGTPTC